MTTAPTLMSAKVSGIGPICSSMAASKSAYNCCTVAESAPAVSSSAAGAGCAMAAGSSVATGSAAASWAGADAQPKDSIIASASRIESSFFMKNSSSKWYNFVYIKGQSPRIPYGSFQPTRPLRSRNSAITTAQRSMAPVMNC
ncbi:hypothetical protein SDC9_162717 [bioreactor metagenome]|uniref:Uncharacterized protein n=1 Tax=bioreactor metagenome TaxID=1076179 RepID=A0A645FLV8_9ZZZZ